jgi:hypothetical protein
VSNIHLCTVQAVQSILSFPNQTQVRATQGSDKRQATFNRHKPAQAATSYMLTQGSDKRQATFNRHKPAQAATSYSHASFNRRYKPHSTATTATSRFQSLKTGTNHWQATFSHHKHFQPPQALSGTKHFQQTDTSSNSKWHRRDLLVA